MEIGTGKKKMGLSTQIFIALLAGAICGVCVHYFLKEGYFRDTILVLSLIHISQIITLALRRANEGGLANILDYIPEGITPVSYTHLDVYKRQQ